MTSPSETIAEAMEGVTPGPWKNIGRLGENGQYTIKSDPYYVAEITGFQENDQATADYIAACNPVAMREVLDELYALRESALQLKAMQREIAEKDAEASWHPITTCPIREPVDLWCVYGGEEFAQYDGGASIGKVVPNRHKTEEYGFFGNQSNDGVPQGHARDLIPVAWRKAVPQCPSELIAEVLGIPRTIEDARALIGGGDD